MKSLGIIGGVGPETSAEFYLDVILQCQKLNNDHRPLIVMSSIPYSYKLEDDEIHKGIITEQAKQYLITEAKRLEKSGIDFIVLPCNTLHLFIEEIRGSVNITVLNILEETVKFIKARGFSKIGLISTSATVKNKLYEKQFNGSGITYTTPNGLQSAEIDKIIGRLTNGVHLNKDRLTLLSIIEDLNGQGVECVLLACTDLQILMPSNNEIPIFDTMKILSDAAVENILG
jgi:aspartate racemase